MTESYIIPEFDENGNFLSDDVKARIVEMIKANAPEPAPPQPSGPVVVYGAEGHPSIPWTLAEPLPENLPMGSYFIPTNSFFGTPRYRLAPNGWVAEGMYYSYIHALSGADNGLLLLVKRGQETLTPTWHDVSTTVTNTFVMFNIDVGGVDLKAGDVLSVFMEGPYYAFMSQSHVAQALPHILTSDSVMEFYPATIGLMGEYFNDEYVSGTEVKVLVPNDRNSLRFSIKADLLNPAGDMFKTNRNYITPAERVQVEVPKPTLEQDEAGTKGTVTIPSVEGVTWHASFKGWSAPEDIVEPGVYEVLAGEHARFTITARSKKGYIIKGGQAEAKPWENSFTFHYRLGPAADLPIPKALTATTKDGMTGWIVRFPEAKGGRYMATIAISSEGWPLYEDVAGDVFMPNGGFVYRSATDPYILPDEQMSALSLNADGSFTQVW